jgi:ribose transport system ATP-binding protein
MSDVILKSESLCKRFSSTVAVDDVSLEFTKGEIHGLIGENGSGKSTYCSLLCGIHPVTSGRFVFDGKPLIVKSQVEANRLGISIIVQEMGTLPGLTVTENIYFGEEDKFMVGVFKKSGTMIREGQGLLDSYGFKRINASKLIDNYSFEDRKLVEIVKATYFDPKILVVDETTTALSQSGREELFRVMNRVKQNGNTVIFISHDLQEVIDHTDRISVLRDGKLVGTVQSAGTNSDELKRMMVGRELDNRYYRTDYQTATSERVVLSVNDVSVPNEITNVSFDLHEGEILGIGGLSECGMHEIGKAIFGASFGRTGKVTLSDGYSVKTIPGAIKHSIAYASKDRDNESVVIADSIRDNVCLPSLDDLSRLALLNHRKLDQFAGKYAQLMSVKMTHIGQYVSNLSGGNKQKVVLSRWLGKGSNILVLDGPTRGIDVRVKADIYALMTDLKQQGKSIVVISEELQELLGMCDRILIMKDGRLNGEFLRNQNLSERDLIAKMV